jgi:hypothetical protein
MRHELFICWIHKEAITRNWCHRRWNYYIIIITNLLAKTLPTFLGIFSHLGLPCFILLVTLPVSWNRCMVVDIQGESY